MFPSVFEDDDLFEEFFVKDVSVSENISRDVRFLTGKIDHSKFDETRLVQPKLVDVLIENSQLANAHWEKSLFSRVSIINSKLTGFQAIQSKWDDVTVKASRANLSLFILTKFKNVIFEDCILTDADFQECEMENVKFYKCDLANASFLGVKFKNVDLRGSKIENIRIGPDQFKGIIVEPFQASYLIGTTGAKVSWLDDEEGQ